MTAVVGLGLRLARAGGRLRAWSITVGNAVGVVLLLGALALPSAVYPDEAARAAARVQLLAGMSLLLVPTTVLLVTVGRLSSGVRDRRLGALRMLGIGRAQARAVAAVENGGLALTGALAGTALFLALARPVSRAMTPRWLTQPAHVPAAGVAWSVAGVVALSVAVGTAATWDRELPGGARSESSRRRPRARRLAVLGTGLGALTTLATLDPGTTADDLETVLFLGGTAVTAVGIALVTPLVTAWLSNGLARARSTAALLAARAIQTDSAGAARVVAGIGVAVFASVGALALLGAYQNAPQYRYALQVFGAGPQTAHVAASDGAAGPANPTFTDDDLAALSAVPGVLGVVPDYLLRAEAVDGSVVPVFAGTCAQLALVVETTGCDDTRAARIVPDNRQVVGADWLWIPDSELADRTTVGVDLLYGEVFDADDVPASRTVDLSGPPIVEHVQQQVDRWVYPTSDVAFVPLSLVADLVGQPSRGEVVATGGTQVQQRIAAWADERGYWAPPYPRREFDDLMAIRAAIGALCAVVIGVGLLVLALTAADRATERRRSVARQVAVGVPARVLRAGQLVQTLLPTAVAGSLALGSGAVALAAYTNEAGMADLIDTRSWLMLVAAVAVGALLVAASTVPLIRTRLTPDLLRRE